MASGELNAISLSAAFLLEHADIYVLFIYLEHGVSPDDFR